MRIVLHIPKRQVRVAAAASVVVALGAGAGVAAQTDAQLLGGGRGSNSDALSVPAVPHDRTLDFEPHPEARLEAGVVEPFVAEPVTALSIVDPEPLLQSTQAPQSASAPLSPQDPQTPPLPDEPGEQGEAGQEQAAPIPADPNESLLSPEEREALALVEQIIREQEGVLMGSAFDYVAGNRRDPFRSLLITTGAVAAPTARPPGLAGFLVSEVELKGIAMSNGRWHAMVVAANQKAYFLEVGTQLFDGHVVDIRPGEVLFEQVVVDALGARRTREVTKRLRTTNGGGEIP